MRLSADSGRLARSRRRRGSALARPASASRECRTPRAPLGVPAGEPAGHDPATRFFHLCIEFGHSVRVAAHPVGEQVGADAEHCGDRRAALVSDPVGACRTLALGRQVTAHVHFSAGLVTIAWLCI